MKNNYSLLGIFIAVSLLFFASCSMNENSSSSKLEVDDSGYVELSMNVTNSAFRSALPDNPSEMYFQVAAFNVASGNVSAITDYSKAVAAFKTSGNATDKSFKVIDNGATKSVTFKLKAGQVWVLVAQGGSVAYSENYFQSSSLVDTNAKDNGIYTTDGTSGGTAATVYVKGYKMIYINSSDGTVYYGSDALTGTPITTGTNIIIPTAADTNGSGTVVLPIQVPHTSPDAYPDSYITSITMTLTNTGTGTGLLSYIGTATGTWGSETEKIFSFKTGSGSDSNIATTATPLVPVESIQSGCYDVLITCTDGTNTLYTYSETLTVWNDRTSHWVSSSGSLGEATYSKLGTDTFNTLCFSSDYIKNYVRTVFYVRGAADATIIAGTGTADGSIFKPFTTVTEALKKCTDSGANWTIYVNGTTTEGVDFSSAANTTNNSTISIKRLLTTGAIGSAKTFTCNGGITLTNMTMKCNIVVAATDFILVNSTVDSANTVTVNDGKYITVDAANVPTGTGTIATVVPADTTALNALILKHYDPDQSGAISDDDENEKAAMLTEAIVDRFPLASTYATDTKANYVIGVDSDTADNLDTGAGTYGDGILKVKQTVELTTGVSLTVTPTVSIANDDTTTTSNEIKTTKISADGNLITVTLKVENGTTDLTDDTGLTYSAFNLSLKQNGNDYVKTGTASTTKSQTLTLPENVKNITSSEVYDLVATVTLGYSGGTASYSFTIPITVTYVAP